MGRFTEADIGKKVKCVSGNWMLFENDIYIIEHISEIDLIRLSGVDGLWDMDRFVLVEEEQQVKETPDNTFLIPFSMELYKQGYEAVCRDLSIKVVNVFETGCDDNPLGATLERNGLQSVRIYQTSSGEYFKESELDIDLFLKEKEKWVNIWINQYTRKDLMGKTTVLYTSKEKAEEDAMKHPVDGWEWVGAIKLPDSV